MTTVISVENLSKRYRLGVIGSRTIRDDLNRWWARLRGNPDPLLKIGDVENGDREGEYILALRDVNLQVEQGEVLGIIGRNGAGKSTLLKILSRVTAPTSGIVKVEGRIASLLEVGTGFHPELTGRENIYMNGAILGMSRSEINRKMDEIVDFSGVEKFIDTPVKRYSSGMYVRLAFAVAAHLDPEILVVDEVLAVGDAAFQKKCLGKMGNVASEGRTVLFVSHNMPSIVTLCQRAVLLDRGTKMLDGPASEVVGEYLLGGNRTTAEKIWPDLQDAPGNEIARLRAARVRAEDGRSCEHFDISQPIGIEIEYDVLQAGHILVPSAHFHTETGLYAFCTIDHDPDWKRKPRPTGRFVSTVWIPGNFLADGTMSVSIMMATMKPERTHFSELDVLSFQVIDNMNGDTARGDFVKSMPGVVRPLLPWKNQYLG